jgi:hypothetical protein
MCEQCKEMFDGATEHANQLETLPVYQLIALTHEAPLSAGATALDFALTDFDRDGDRGPDGEYTAEYVAQYAARRERFMKLVRYVHYQGVRTGLTMALPDVAEAVVDVQAGPFTPADDALAAAITAMHGFDSIEELLDAMRAEREQAQNTAALMQALFDGDDAQIRAIAEKLGIEVEMHTADEPGDDLTGASDADAVYVDGVRYRRPPTA